MSHFPGIKYRSFDYHLHGTPRRRRDRDRRTYGTCVPRRLPSGSIVVAAGAGVDTLRISTAAATVLATAALFIALVAAFVPCAPATAFSHVPDESDDSFGWTCSTPFGYRSSELDMDIPREAVESSMERHVLRCGTVFVPAPVLLVDPDDQYVVRVAEHILRISEGWSDDAKARAALNFVQTAIDYCSDSDLYGCDEFWAAPVETLFMHAGDCEDTAVLLCSILGAMGLDWVLLDYPSHSAVGYGDANGYLFCETTYDSPSALDAGRRGNEPEAYGPEDVSGIRSAVNGSIAWTRDLFETNCFPIVWTIEGH